MKKIYGIIASSLLALTSYGAEQLTVALDWTPNPNHSGVYVAMANGYYKDAGIDIKIAPYGDVSPIQLVMIKKADIAFMGTEGLMIVNSSNNIDLTAIAETLSENAQYIASRADSGIKSPKDFVGKVYATWTNGWDVALINQMIIADGGQGEIKAPDLGAYGPTALLAGKIDLSWFFDNVETPLAKKQNVAINKFYFKDYGLANYGSPILSVRTQSLKEDRDLYQRFITATQKGYEWAAKNPTDATEALIKFSPPGTFEDKKLLMEQQEISSRYYVGKDGWGKMDDTEMSKLADFMVNQKIVPNKGSLKYTNEFFKE
ncbi:MAG: ABC transporter substrate-binding protein [Alphaproteobacteria bacterium]